MAPLYGRDSCIYDHSDERMDILAVKLRDMIFVNVYIRMAGNQGAREALDKFMEHLDSITEDHDGLPTVVAGDFNAPRHTQLLLELMEADRFRPILPSGEELPPPTIVAAHLIGSLSKGNVTNSPLNITIRAQDHGILGTTITLPLAPEAQAASTSYNWRQLQRMSPEQRAEFYRDRDTLAHESVSLSDFRRRLQDLLRRHLGVRRHTQTRLPRGWFTPEVSDARRAFWHANKQYHRNRTIETLDNMRTASRTYTKMVRQQKRKAVATLATRVDLGLASIHRLAGPVKKDPKHQSRILPDPEGVKAFWRDQFSDPDALEAASLGRDFQCVFSPAELLQAIEQIDPKKATGEDDIRHPIFEHLTEAFVGDVARLFTAEAQSPEPLPHWMKVGNATTLYKHKGSKADPSNYRVIIINSLLAKIYEKMLEIKGRKLISEGTLNISVEQGGFMPKRSTHDSLFILESLRDAQISKKRPLYAAFLDMRKAFDSVNHEKFIELLRTSGCPESWTTQLIKMLAGRQMKLFDALISLEVGTAQGSPISPLLFILFINPLVERLRACRGIQFTSTAGAYIRSLLFADDICLVAETKEDLQLMLDICQQWTEEFRMSFNPAKCELIQLAGSTGQAPPALQLGGVVLSWVSEG